MSTLGDRTPAPTLVTTGTGSGKTECFLYPVLDHCLRAAKRGERGIKAIVLYPMNALASDQAQRFAREIHDHPELRELVSAGLYVGGKGSNRTPGRDHLVDDRNVLRVAPPDILLTNYKMLDYLLMRPEDRELWRFNEPDSLRYLVLDELHSYDGAQGSDVACLIRRLRARLKVRESALACIGTSATIGGGGTANELRKFASDIFQVPIEPDALVREDRLSLSEAFPPAGPDEALTEDAFAAPARSLDPEYFETPDAYVEAQAVRWLGEMPASPVALGEMIGRHAFLRRLLEARESLGGKGPHGWTELARRIAQAEPEFEALPQETQWLVLASFLALVARARRVDGKRERPFLDLQVTLWVRELRGLVRKLESGPAQLAWREALESDRGVHWGAIVSCRECGVDGLGALAREGSSRLQLDSRKVGEAYLTQSAYARFLQLGASPGQGELQNAS